MESTQKDNIFSFEIGNVNREIMYIKSVHIASGIDSDVYSFLDDKSQVLSIVRVKRGVKSPLEKIESANKIIEGFLKGKGTLSVSTFGNNKNTYYFETAGYNKEVEIHTGESVQWSAPKDADLIYYKIRDLPKEVEPTPAPAPAPRQVRTTKIMLASSPINGDQAQALANLVKKPKHSVTLGLIENGIDVSPKIKVESFANRQNMQHYGFNVQLIDLHIYQNNHVELFETLEKLDVIWFGSGNVFYLNWLLQVTRAGDILKYLINRGVVYGGDGAGAIVAGPTLKHFETVDDQNLVPEIGLEGLKIINYVTIPHFDDEKNKRTLAELNKRLLKEGYQTLPLNDGQAFIIDGNEERYL